MIRRKSKRSIVNVGYLVLLIKVVEDRKPPFRRILAFPDPDIAIDPGLL